MAVVGFRREADLRPLVAGECDRIRLLAPGRHRVALTHRVPAHLPGSRVERLGMVGQRVEIELRAKPGKVAGVGRRVHALASHQGKAPHERVDRQRRVDVEVAKEDAVALVGGRPLLPRDSRRYALRRERDARNFAIELLLGAPVDEPKSQNQQHQAKNDRKTTLFPPSHAAGSIGRDIRLSKQSRGGRCLEG